MSILDQARRELKQFDMIKELCPHFSQEEQQFYSLNKLRGCKKGGFGVECQNCCAVSLMNVLRGSRGNAAKQCRKTIVKIGKKWYWNGMFIENSDWLKGFSYNPSSNFKKYIVSYESDISLWSPYEIASNYEVALKAPKHEFYFLSKDPKTLLRKSKKAWELLGVNKISLIKTNNIIQCTSVGVNKSLDRIDDLRKFSKYGFRLEVWFKPVLENMLNIDLSLINTIRINAEKGHHSRNWEPSWMVSLLKAARKYNTTVSFDMHHKVLQKKRTDYMNKVTASIERTMPKFSTAR